ncbi:MAG: RNA repair transcriptional activator RtcR [Planctomycetes bacterium]|nr:RNA repair transcriptional activator RtcR [Planctomycetota bacterium]
MGIRSFCQLTRASRETLCKHEASKQDLQIKTYTHPVDLDGSIRYTWIVTRPTVVIGFLGSTLDKGSKPKRWERWRPTIDLCRQPELPIARLELLHFPGHTALVEQVASDLAEVAPETEVRPTAMRIKNAWDFEEVFAALHDYALGYPFRPEDEDYLIHVTTGSHVIQICLFLLTESRHFPGKLIQGSPARGQPKGSVGRVSVIDLDLGRYDRLAQRFAAQRARKLSLLKGGIPTRNAGYNRLIAELEQVATASTAPILFCGPTGAGKSNLARRVYALRQAAHHVRGRLVEVNCATLRGDAAMSTLFGHVKGAFTGAARDRPGLLRAAHQGVLFLDEVGELGLDEQAMLLRALEEKRFLPLGADVEVESDFQLLAGTNRDLEQAVREGRFREDLLARIDLWTFRLPSLRERPEDLEPNLDHELEQTARRTGQRVTFNREAREAFLAFAARYPWPRNFRDLSACVTRLATLAPGGRITRAGVEAEVARLEGGGHVAGAAEGVLEEVLRPAQLAELDRFDRVQLEEVARVCRASTSLAAAGRTLFQASHRRRSTRNDGDRLRKYLAKYGLTFSELARARPAPD